MLILLANYHLIVTLSGANREAVAASGGSTPPVRPGGGGRGGPGPQYGPRTAAGGGGGSSGGLEISAPFNFQHLTHVVPDPSTATGFKVNIYLVRTFGTSSGSEQGLPPGWEVLLKTSKITKEEVPTVLDD